MQKRGSSKKRSSARPKGVQTKVRSYGAPFREQTLAVLRKNPYSQFLPHYFRRQLDDGVFYCSAPNVVSVVNAVGGVPLWASLSSGLPDQGGVGGTQQFGFSIQIALSQVQAYTEFTNLFQQYQVVGLTIDIMPCMGDSSYNSNAQLPMITIAEDYNDAVAPTAFNGIQQNNSSKSFVLTAETRRKFTCRPIPAVPLYSGSVSSVYSAVAKDMWLDTTGASSSTPHYSFKGYCRNFVVNAANQGMGFRIIPTLSFRCRGSH